MAIHDVIKRVMKRLTFSVPEETNDSLVALAEEWGLSKSQVIKLLLERGLNIELLTREGGEILYRHPAGKLNVIYRPAVNSIDNQPHLILKHDPSAVTLDAIVKEGEQHHS